ncbi:uncharacterized protein N0V89_011056 [Didymosphaeria variabile]|uniref:Uncharacterized protein n=1 Tax=Didymosphaeria variabile TaxID=1932322 RepID=A0A9W8XCS2_9PLEO|nr:uncharacterized protein N0V89_011056 [Didymosphaeria variabile]KAJ4347118.1 hypothetical protein N0V89_011056 [Didymosphaeria variabile]
MSPSIAVREIGILKPRKKSTLESLNNDCLALVFQEVALTSHKSLLPLSRVNHRFYMLVVRWIYGDVSINITKVTHLLLLKRLLQPRSKLASYIRYLEITPADSTPFWFLQDVVNVLKRLAVLYTFCWNVFSNVYPLILCELVRFPKATLVVRGNKIAYYASSPGDKTLTLLHVFPASRLAFPNGNLTEFTFDAQLPSQIYDNFKEDILKLMVNNPSLATLSLQPRHFSLQAFPQMLDVFRSGNVPNLIHLAVRGWALSIFHQDELKLWGQKIGWERLRTLSIDISAFPALVGKTPVLADLELTATTSADLIQLQLQLLEMEYPVGCLLPRLTEFHLRTPLDRMLISTARRPALILPMILFRIMPKILTMNMGSSYTMSINTVSFVPMILATPAAQDIDKLRKYCPIIQKLSIDINLDQGWPFDVLKKVARFKDLHYLTLMLHFEHLNNAKKRMTLSNCKDAFGYIARSRHLPHGKQDLRERLVVRFKLARMNDDDTAIRRGFDMPDYAVWTDAVGILTKTYKYEAPSRTKPVSTLVALSNEQLDKRAQKEWRVWYFTKPFLPFLTKYHDRAASNLQRLWQESQRRQFEATGGSPTNMDKQVTLFDQWSGEE